MAAARLSKGRLGRLHSAMAGYVERGELPGLVTAVGRRDELHVDAIGVLAFGVRDPMRRDTIFRISSMTKPITAAAAMILIEECRLTPEQKSVSGLVPGFFDSHGWGFGLAVVTRREAVAGSVGAYGWDGGLGTCWLSDPREEMVTVLMTQVAWASPGPPPVCLDCRTLAYQAVDD
jgi:CubicO group peptidase (beta-lactamase class C family)